MWSCCVVKQIAVLYIRDSPAVFGGGGVGGGRGVAAPNTGITEDGGAGGTWRGGRGRTKRDSFLVTFYIRHTKNSEQTAE